MGSDYMQAWCECSHCASWHDDDALALIERRTT